MDIVTPIIGILSLLLEPIAQRVRVAVRLDKNLQLLTESLSELGSIRVDIERRVLAAEAQLMTRTLQVRLWLQRVQDIEGKVRKIEDLLRQRRIRYNLGKKVAKMLKVVEELKKKGVSMEVVAESSVPGPVEEIPCSSTVGSNASLGALQDYINKEGVTKIGIYGMGGVGKTTLLQQMNNRFLRGSHYFDVVIWVVVSKGFSIRRIQKAIRDRLQLPSPEDKDEDQLGREIFKILQNKRFLLLLDDLWEKLDLVKVGIPYLTCENKCKIIFTTRSEAVCGQMGAQKKIKVDCLKPADAWELFREKMGEEALNSHPDIPRLAKEVAEKCSGLPLAVISVGRAMANKKSPEEWRYAISTLNKNPHEFQGMDQVLSLLKFSYDNLPEGSMKLCFLYCALFPEDYSIEKEQLVQFWMGEGFLDEFEKIDEAYDKGYYIIGSLKHGCLLESGGNAEKEVKIHDVIRDMSLWVASGCEKKNKNVIVQAGIGLSEAPEADKWATAERMSLMKNKINALLGNPFSPNLQTLMLQQNWCLNTISDSFFQFMPALRVLDLSRTDIREVPSGITTRVRLRHLDLSHTNITKLPLGISQLAQLQYLNLSHTRITELPEELGVLANLKHLALHHTDSLRSIAREAIVRLFKLQVLDLYYSSFSEWELDARNGEGNRVSLLDLESLKQLTSLGITINNLSSLQGFLGSERLTRCTRRLFVKNAKGLMSIHLNTTFGNMGKLRELEINNCPQIEELQIGVKFEREGWTLSELEKLGLFTLPNLKTIQVGTRSNRCLQNLRDLKIGDCRRLKDLTWVGQLERLEQITLTKCNGIEEIVCGEAAQPGFVPFPKLKQMFVFNLPKLRSICHWPLPFPFLESVVVSECPKLKKLPLDASSAKKTLREIRGFKGWWEQLQWEDTNTKSAFSPFFKE